MASQDKLAFILAPMDDVTDTVFRQIVHSCSPADLYFTEFVNVDGLNSRGRGNLLKKLQFDVSEGPLIAQLWGLKPENFELIARQLADGTIAHELGLPKDINFVGIDLNMGCPAKSEVKSGACSALINNRSLAEQIIQATKRGAGNMPVSVKTRLGFSQVDLSWIEFLLSFNLDMLTVHWRTRKEMSKVPAHWEYANDVVNLRDRLSPDTRLIGNGDVLSRSQGERLINEYGLDGVMIGRGVFNDPYIFADSSPWSELDRKARIDLYIRHVELFSKTWSGNSPSRPIHTLNKFCKIYISGFDGAKEMREKLMFCNSVDELLTILESL